MSDPTYPLFPVFSFLGFILVLIPLPWHFEAWNSSTCYFMIWVALACLNQFVSSVVWAGNALNPAPIWCDISTRIILGASVGIPAASLCINRRLYLVARVRAVIVSRAEKQRAILIDSLVCVLLPVIIIVLSYVVQGHRFNILEDIGCTTALYNTLLTYFLVTCWPLVLGLISAVYCVLSLHAFLKRRAQFHAFLSSDKSSLSFSRYFRLMALACTELLLSVPLSTFIIYLNATTQPVGPWISWSNTHFAFSRTDQIPALLWRQNHQLVVAQELARWIDPVCALIFFAYFGFAEEARRHYRDAFRFATRKVGLLSHRLPLSGFSSSSGKTSLPPFHTLSSTTPSTPLPMYNPLPQMYEQPGSPSSATVLCKPTCGASSFSQVDLKDPHLLSVVPLPIDSPAVASFGPIDGYSITVSEVGSLCTSRTPSFLDSEPSEAGSPVDLTHASHQLHMPRAS